jgi:hypothetical protein
MGNSINQNTILVKSYTCSRALDFRIMDLALLKLPDTTLHNGMDIHKGATEFLASMNLIR